MLGQYYCGWSILNMQIAQALLKAEVLRSVDPKTELSIRNIINSGPDQLKAQKSLEFITKSDSFARYGGTHL